jgi:flagellar hook protein FlgE
MILKQLIVLILSLAFLVGCQQTAARKTVEAPNPALLGDSCEPPELRSMKQEIPPEAIIFSQGKGKQGELQQTDFGLDIALSGGGFFILKDPTGNIFYSRDGRFQNGGDLCLEHRATGFKVQTLSEDKSLRNICFTGMGAKIDAYRAWRSAILVNMSIGPEGIICGVYQDGTVKTMGRIALAFPQYGPEVLDLSKHLLKASSKGGEVFYTVRMTGLGPKFFSKHVEKLDNDFYQAMFRE